MFPLTCIFFGFMHVRGLFIIKVANCVIISAGSCSFTIGSTANEIEPFAKTMTVMPVTAISVILTLSLYCNRLLCRSISHFPCHAFYYRHTFGKKGHHGLGQQITPPKLKSNQRALRGSYAVDREDLTYRNGRQLTTRLFVRKRPVLSTVTLTVNSA